jgi:hypothetical protein
MMNNWAGLVRQKLAAGGRRFFSAPYLPPTLIWAALLIALTDLSVVLLAQPAGYWITSNRAESGLPFLKSILVSGMGWYSLAVLLYLGLLGLALTLITRSAALVAWLTVSFVHLNHTLLWLAGRFIPVDLIANTITPLLLNALTGLLLGLILSLLLLRAKTIASPGKMVLWLRGGLPVAWVVVLMGVIAFRALIPKSGWQQINPLHSPGQRASMALGYDPIRQRAVLFGGYGGWLGSGFDVKNDTWEWDGTDWHEMKPEHSPSPRQGASMAYDQEHGTMILFGGEDKSGNYMYNDTWLWDGKDWQQLFPENLPAPRRGAQMFFDGDTHQLLLAGGFTWKGTDKDKTPSPYGDTWAWDGSNWLYLISNDQPFIVTSPTVAYDPTRKRSVVFDVNRMLTWNGASWQVAQTTGMPQNRFGPTLAIDTNNGKILFFGGVTDGIQSNDTWLLEGDTWQKLNPDLTPSARDAHAMFYDPVRKSYILYGGVSIYTLDNMWEFVLP